MTLLLGGCAAQKGDDGAQTGEALTQALEQAGDSMGPYTMQKQAETQPEAAAKALILRFLRDFKTQQAGRSFTLPAVESVTPTLTDGSQLIAGQWQVAFDAVVTVTGTVGEDTLDNVSCTAGLKAGLLEDAGSYFAFYPTAASYARIHNDTRYQSLESAGEAAEPYRVPLGAVASPQAAAEQLVRQFAEDLKQADARYAFRVTQVAAVACALYDAAYYAKNEGQCEPSAYSLTEGQWQVVATCGLGYTGEINGISPDTLQAEFGTDIYTDMLRYGLLEQTDSEYVFYPMPACYARATDGAGA